MSARASPLIAFSADGMLFTAGDGTLREVATGTVKATLERYDTNVTSLAFAPEGRNRDVIVAGYANGLLRA